MKKSFVLFVSAIMLICFNSCEKNNSTPPTNITNTVYMEPTLSATVNGVPIVYVGTLNPSQGTWLQILGSSQYSGLAINLPSPTDTITYVLGAGGYVPGVSFDSGKIQNYTPIGTSVIKITSYNKATALFSGTFNVTLQDSANGKKTVITNGVFSNF
jgi:hypothetical protein